MSEVKPNEGDTIEVYGYQSRFKVLWIQKRPIALYRCRVTNSKEEYEFPRRYIKRIVKTGTKKK